MKTLNKTILFITVCSIILTMTGEASACWPLALIYGEPEYSYPWTVCLNQPVYLDGGDSLPEEGIYKYYWQKDGGPLEEGPSSKAFSFSSPGNHTVYLLVSIWDETYGEIFSDDCAVAHVTVNGCCNSNCQCSTTIIDHIDGPIIAYPFEYFTFTASYTGDESCLRWFINGQPFDCTGTDIILPFFTTAGTYTISVSTCNEGSSKEKEVTVVRVGSVTANKAIKIVSDEWDPIIFTANPDPEGQPLDYISWGYSIRQNLNDAIVWKNLEDPLHVSQQSYNRPGGWIKYRAKNGINDDWTESFSWVCVLELTEIRYKEGDIWISPTRQGGDISVCVKKGQTVSFKAVKIPNDSGNWPDGKPVWGGAASGKTGEIVNVTFNEVGSFTVSAECGYTKSINVVVQGALFIENPSQSYGFDNWTNPVIPYKSVRTGTPNSDTAKADIAISPVSNVYFRVKE